MKKILASFLLFSVFLTTAVSFSQEINSTDGKAPLSEYLVGNVPGQLSVSPTGAAIYTVPLSFPEGLAGMTPVLALEYNSQGAFGFLGDKWGLKGLSYIDRKPESVYYNGHNGSIDWADDLYALDGNTLIEINRSGNDVEYRTEVDMIAQIIQHDAGKGAKSSDYFEVRKDGLTYIYNARQVYEYNENVAIRYYLGEVRDIKGNAIKYFYLKDDEFIQNGEIYLDRIEYTYNETGNDDIFPHYIVRLNYQDLADKYKRTSYFNYGAGNNYQFCVTQLLSSIEVFNKDQDNGTETRIKKYMFGYQNSGALNAPFLSSVHLLDGPGTAYFHPTSFQWQYNTPLEDHYEQAFSTISEWFSYPQSKFISGDINGDGMADLIDGEWGQGPELIRLRIGPQLSIVQDSIEVKIGDIVSAVDLNGDGKDEFINFNPGSVDVYRFVKTGNKWTFDKITTIQGNKPLIGDFNGDGLRDILIDDNKLYEGDPEDYLAYPVGISGLPTNLIIRTSGDFTGDGESDILFFDGIKVRIFNLANNGHSFEEAASQDILSNPSDLKGISVGDFNGDGKQDLLLSLYNTGWYNKIYYSNGNGFPFSQVVDLGECGIHHEHMVADLNNDGISDVYRFQYLLSGNSKTMTITYSKYLKYQSVSHGFKSYSETRLHTLTGDDVFHHVASYTIGDFSGNDEPDLFYYTASYESEMKHRQGHLITDEGLGIDAIVKITNGLSAKQKIDYCHYQPYETDALTYPIIPFKGPFYLVQSIHTESGYENQYNYAWYTFDGARIHALGKGFLGFRSNRIDYWTDVRKIYWAEYGLFIKDGKYFHPYLKEDSVYVFNSNTYVRTSRNYYQMDIKSTVFMNQLIYLPVTTESFNKSWDLNGAFISQSKSLQNINDVDIYGNSLKSSHLSTDLPITYYFYETTTEASYDEFIDQENWLVHRPEFIKVTKRRNSDPLDVINTTFTYHDGTVLVKTKTTVPNDDAIFTTIQGFEYDIFGNKSSETISAPNFEVDENAYPVESRTVNYEYSTDNNYDAYFLTAVIRPGPGDEHRTIYEYNLMDGSLEAETDPAGMSTTYHYNSMGQLEKVVLPDGTARATTSHWSDGHEDAPEHASYYISSRKLDAEGKEFETTLTFYDRFMKELRNVTYSLKDERIYSDREYDELGRLTRSSEPYFATGKPELWTSVYFDWWGRLGRTILMTGNEISQQYNGKTISSKNLGTGIITAKTYNAIGDLVTSKDPAGSVSYVYNSAGQVKQIDALGAKTVMTYDSQGNQILLVDPNADTISYVYNPYGELIFQTDDRGKKFEMKYDILGRISDKLLVGGEEKTSYTYYNNLPGPNQTGQGFGLVDRIEKSNGIIYHYSYDALNRLETEGELIPELSPDFMTTTFTYNALNGKPLDQMFPTKYAVSYEYANNGMLLSVKQKDNQKELWRNNNSNERGQISSYKLGNGFSTQKEFDDYGFVTRILTGGAQDLEYRWDPVTGNLMYRKDNWYNNREDFTYDELLKSRLASWQVAGQEKYTAWYSNSGNFYNKSDVAVPQPYPTMWYGGNAGPHALTKVDKPTEKYEARANPQHISYNPAGKLELLTEVITQNELPHTYTDEYIYGPDDARKIHKKYIDRQLNKTTYYIATNYEIHIDAKKTQRHLHYLFGGDGLFAIFEIKITKGRTETATYYIHKDHLGSFETITKDGAGIVEKLSFDPWGRRRNAVNWTFTNVPATFLFERGYTGHEHLDDYELINMNGRVYDPWVGRFLSSDNFVQAPDNSQSYNRYSYAMNNPLKYTDPDGEFWNIIIGAVIGGVVNTVMHWDQIDNFWDGLAAFGIGAAAGAIGGATGGAAFVAAGGAAGGAGGFLAGLAGGAVGTAFSAPVQSVGNAAYFGDPVITGKEYVISILAGGLLSGTANGLVAAFNGRSFWDGHLVGLNQKPIVYRSPVNNNFGKQNGECALRCLEEFSESYDMDQYDFTYWLNQNGGKLGVAPKDFEALVNGSDVFCSDALYPDLNSLTDALANNQRIMTGLTVQQSGSFHAVMVSKIKVWPSGYFKIWFTETSPVRLAPYSLSYKIDEFWKLVNDLGGGRFWSFLLN